MIDEQTGRKKRTKQDQKLRQTYPEAPKSKQSSQGPDDEKDTARKHNHITGEIMAIRIRIISGGNESTHQLFQAHHKQIKIINPDANGNT